MTTTKSERLNRTQFVNKEVVDRRAYKCEASRRCTVWSRRNKYKTRCGQCIWEGSTRNRCYAHEMYTPHFYANGRVNTDIRNIYDAQTFGDDAFVEFCLRIIKDNTRIVQVPIQTDFSKMRIDPRLPFVAYIVVNKPENDHLLSSVVNLNVLRWPMRFIVTNATRLLLTNDDAIWTAYRGPRAEMSREMPTLIAFDVFSSQYNLTEYFDMIHAFNIFFKFMKGYQIFNCKIGHILQETQFNFRLGPLLASNLLRYLENAGPLFDLCMVSEFAERSQDFYRIVEDQTENRRRHLPANDFYSDLLSYRLELNDLRKMIFEDRDIVANTIYFNDADLLQNYPSLEQIVTNVFADIRSFLPVHIVTLQTSPVEYYQDIYTHINNQQNRYTAITEAEALFRRDNNREVAEEFLSLLGATHNAIEIRMAPVYPDLGQINLNNLIYTLPPVGLDVDTAFDQSVNRSPNASEFEPDFEHLDNFYDPANDLFVGETQE